MWGLDEVTSFEEFISHIESLEVPKQVGMLESILVLTLVCKRREKRERLIVCLPVRLQHFSRVLSFIIT